MKPVSGFELRSNYETGIGKHIFVRIYVPDYQSDKF